MARFDALGHQVAAELELDDAILDGEVIAPDSTGARSFTTFSGARGGRPTWPSTFCGSTLPTYAVCRSVSAGGA
jgi:hypothetical protein